MLLVVLSALHQTLAERLLIKTEVEVERVDLVNRHVLGLAKQLHLLDGLRLAARVHCAGKLDQLVRVEEAAVVARRLQRLQAELAAAAHH